MHLALSSCASHLDFLCLSPRLSLCLLECRATPAPVREALASRFYKHSPETHYKTSSVIYGAGRNYKAKTAFINKSGLYSLVLSSKLSKAREFKHWVINEVLPAIRLTGAYMTPNTIMQVMQQPKTLLSKLKQRKKIEKISKGVFGKIS